MERIYARNTNIKVIDEIDAQEFIKNNHSQGALNSNLKKVNLGLFFEGVLVGVAQFSPPRTTKKKKNTQQNY